MPIFEYRCNGCGNQFEELISREKSDSVACPKCTSGDTEKLVSAPGGITMSQSGSVPSCVSSGCPGAGSCGGGQACSLGG